MKRPPFPSSETDLAEWSVYADWLQTQGDPRGELIALDLALPARPDVAALERFHRVFRRLFHGRDTLAITHVLGHARELQLAPGERIKLSKGAMASPEAGTLTNLRDLLLAEADGSITQVALVQPFEDNEAHWRRLIHAIPPSCSRVVLTLRRLTEGHARELVARLPATVKELGLHGMLGGYPTPPAAHHLIDDRFDAVAIVDLDMFVLDVPAALARTGRVRVQLRTTSWPLAPRVELGRPGDAGFIRPDDTRAVVVPRWSAMMLAGHHGPLGIRALLAGELAESFTVSLANSVRPIGNDLVRRGRVWTLRGRDDGDTFVDGTRVAPGVLVKLDAGVPVRFGTPEEWTFVKSDPTTEARRLWR